VLRELSGRSTAGVSAGTAQGLLRSGSAATAAQLVRIFALQATHIVVRRLVPPDEMGVWNWLEPLFLLLATVRDLGVPSHVVRLRPMPLGTLLRVQIGFGALLALAVVLAAPLLALGFREPVPALVTAIQVLAVFLLLEGLSATALTAFEGHLAIERTLRAELLRTATYCIVVLFAAAAGWSFWSFVAAQVAAQALYALALWRRALADRFDLRHLPGTTLAVVRGSLPVGFVVLLAMTVSWVDLFVVGRLFPRAEVGLYAFGYAYAFLVMRVLQQPVGRSLYPALVAFDAERADQFRAYRLATLFVLAIEVPTAFLVATNAQLLTLLLAGPEYLGAAPYLVLLAFAPIVEPLGRFGGELLMARRHDGARILALALQLVVLVGGGAGLSLWLGSPAGMAIAHYLPVGSLVVLLVLVRDGDRRHLLDLGRQLGEVYLLPLAPFALAWSFTPAGSWARLAATTLAALVCFAWVWRRWGSDVRAFFARPTDA
jgi:O-antigen/teichoic acid export membrane protein